jgi:hypothetical protein
MYGTTNGTKQEKRYYIYVSCGRTLVDMRALALLHILQFFC